MINLLFLSELKAKEPRPRPLVSSLFCYCLFSDNKVNANWQANDKKVYHTKQSKKGASFPLQNCYQYRHKQLNHILLIAKKTLNINSKEPKAISILKLLLSAKNIGIDLSLVLSDS